MECQMSAGETTPVPPLVSTGIGLLPDPAIGEIRYSAASSLVGVTEM